MSNNSYYTDSVNKYIDTWINEDINNRTRLEFWSMPLAEKKRIFMRLIIDRNKKFLQKNGIKLTYELEELYYQENSDEENVAKTLINLKN
jgi:hypothetical protein